MKLVVEVVEAHDLMPRDGEGSSSAFAEVDYDNHLSRTRTVTKDLNPVWDQKLEFVISNPEKFRTQSIQISVYNDRKGFPGRNFLGKATVHCSNIVCEGEEVLQRFPLEKKWFFSPVKGDIALKLYVSPKSVGSAPVADEKEASKEAAVTVQTLRHISKNQFTPQPGKTVEEKSSGGATAPVVMMHQAKPSSADEYKLKDTSPQLGERWRTGGHWRGGWMGIGADHKLTSTYDLVEQMHYLYVRVVKAKDLPTNPVTGSCDPYAEVKLGNYKGTTKHLEKKTNPEWNQVFAFSKERIQSSVLEVYVKDKEVVTRDDYIGKVVFDLNEVPTRVPPDSPLAPQWYRLENHRGDGKVRGEIMLAVWMGTQADEAFPEAWHADAASVHGEGIYNIRSKVYVSPKLWYLRVNVIEAQDVQPNDRSRIPEVFCKVQVGNQVLKTKICPARTLNPLWNEDLVFVAAEPFEEQLVLTIEDRVSPTKDDILGRLVLPLTIFEKRLDHRPIVDTRWFNLERFGFSVLEGEKRKELKFSTRVHLRACLEGGYHVMDESTMYISDQRPTARQLWKQPIGILEVGILGTQGLVLMKTKNKKLKHSADDHIPKFTQNHNKLTTSSLTPVAKACKEPNFFSPTTVSNHKFTQKRQASRSSHGRSRSEEVGTID